MSKLRKDSIQWQTFRVISAQGSRSSVSFVGISLPELGCFAKRNRLVYRYERRSHHQVDEIEGGFCVTFVEK
jgi:hypothetical protein